jgi:glucokinase
MKPVVGIDLGGTTFTVAVIERDLTVRRATERPTPAALPAARALGVIADAACELLAAAHMGRGDVAAVGVAIPGSVDAARGRSRFAPNLPGWRDEPVRDVLAEALALPVALDHDVRMAALAESRVGAGRDARVFALVTVGTGVGAAIVVEGALHRGVSDAAGEVGHLPWRGDTPCGCGRRGCVEAVGSGRAMARRARARVGTGRRSSVVDLVDGRTDAITAREVLAAARAGDALCAAVVDEAVAALGFALVTLVNVLNPDVIAVGGGVAQAGPWLLDRLRDVVAADAWRPGREVARIVPAALGTRSGVIGAGILALEVFTEAAACRV